VPVHAVEARFVGRKRPGGAGVVDRAVGCPRRAKGGLCFRGGVEYTECEERRATAGGQEGRQPGLQQVACLVGEISGEPFAFITKGTGYFYFSFIVKPVDICQVPLLDFGSTRGILAAITAGNIFFMLKNFLSI